MQQLDEKIAQLAQMLKRSQILSAEQLELVKQIDTFYEQHAGESVKKNKKVQSIKFEYDESADQGVELEEDFEKYAAEQQQAREQAKQQRQQQKREQAEQMAAQSLKTVYLKIAAMIHPDREQDETKKLEKTELFQQASQAYEKQDLFYLLFHLYNQQNEWCPKGFLHSEILQQPLFLLFLVEQMPLLKKWPLQHLKFFSSQNITII